MNNRWGASTPREVAREAVIDHLSAPRAGELPADASFYDLGIDSLDVIEIMMDIEDELNVLLDDERPLLTLSDMESAVAEALAIKQARAA